ncbi:UDP-N-acetylmuramyl pentapeptide phosphotransferase/UDP-N-acetylglucosamine-1-phosphate transferase [Flavobacterium fluvii]|uniref:UDP-N-acetylmuramyl pentapeptide phosphotransferase/UDP-N-acetylglucosamine-1-phosphate transferase n=1 Tax=Flavobacterium fluvii TaxID=468056 RepID=A0A1M5INL3_9FLAO|nr:UDP-GlcNAc--UDP-phosphate GlcNAc-1-phosphate transferase [Flavobacterium fluvii]SHG29954.1 UDP-N-acetylmuramyl pentapeptide phosphotransferase/UDP-N-acetylglucosamine-1-phosphate transferase [Flavobacterium fluvii]
MNYIIIALILFFLELIYFKMADRYNIIDKPNHRSSHSQITLRGGGIIFPIAVLIAFLLDYVGWTIALAVVLVAIVSFIDDIKPLSQLPRFGSHIIAVLLIAYDLNFFQEAFWVLPLVLVLLIGWINAFNFMDGINGITVLYAFVAIVSFSFLEINKESLPLLITMGLSCCAFGFFNVRKKAKTFAGDVGSISMAVFLGYFLVKTIAETGQVGYILFFSIYGIDAIITIIIRIKKKENIFEPHRSHLYQYLANEWGHSHIAISVIYAALQLLVNGIVVCLDQQGQLSISNSLVILFVLTFVYLAIRAFVVRKISIKST